ncbi:MAG: hypothetical protein WD627_12645 [Actinomycetota bacterium]
MVAVILVMSACSAESGDSNQSLGSATVLEGRATLTHEGKTRAINAEVPVTAGDVVSVEGRDVALVRLSESRDFELRGGDLTVVSSDAVSLEGGSLLVEAGGAVEVRTGGARALFTTGTVRFDGPAVGRIGAYYAEGLQILSGEQTIDLPRYWQLVVGSDGRLDQGRPLQISGDDIWDQRLLANALETDANLANPATGFDAQFGATTPPALLERLSVIGIGADALAPFAGSPRSDLVLALAFARESKKDAASELGQGFLESLTLNAIGASWGLLAEQFGVDPARFIERFQAEINSIPIAPPPAPTPPAGPSRPRRPSGARPSPSPAPPPVQPSPAVPPVTAPLPGSPGNPDSIIPLLPEDLRRIIDELYGLVEDLLPII